jgi:hypothetical protein
MTTTEKERLPLDEFTRRFVAHAIAYAGFTTFKDGSSVSAYAATAAKTYWDEQHQNGESPEACAEADVAEWEF